MRLTVFCVVALFATALATFADGPTFDVASVKLYSPEIQQPWKITGGPGTNDPSRFRADRITLIALLARAFDVSTDQITGQPWLRDLASGNEYTVTATMPPDTTKEQFRKMFENPLVERFHLVFHRETKNFPGYALVVDKGGPKFKEVAPTPGADPDAARGSMILMGAGPNGTGDGFPSLPPGPRTMTLSRGGEQRTKYQERTMAEFVSNLGFLIGSSQGKSVLDGIVQPRVLDKTGLTGKYTFILEYYSEGYAALARQFQASTGSDTANGVPPTPSDPSANLPNIFVAIQKQLGLRLDKTADVPLDMIVVESVDKVPTPD